MRIGIITIINVNNYGAELQAYALQRFLQLMGYDAEIIDYPYYKNHLHIRERASRPFYAYPLKYRLKEWARMLADMAVRRFKRKSVKERERKFLKFHEMNTAFSDKCYRRYSELYAEPPIYDVYCVGSDQVWNPYCYTNLNPYFLTFATHGSKKFSYASSFGVDKLPDAVKKTYKMGLGGLGRISVRESAGVVLVKELTGRDAYLVADPTLLLDENEWSRVERCVKKNTADYVLVYELHPLPTIMEMAVKIAKIRKLEVVRLCKDQTSSSHMDGVVNIIDAGPAEFVYLFRHATCVITNSFHGTAFSVNFHKNFYCVLSKNAKNNCRQTSLLSLCGLVDRIIWEGEDLPDISDIDINYKKVIPALESFVSESKQFIKEAIDGKKQTIS